MTVNIVEIFYSIQGEGKYLGSPMVFVRLAGCDVGCAWCDTDHALREELSTEEAVQRIQSLALPGSFVSLTGGEPLLQADALKVMLPVLKEAGMRIFLETNGILYQAFSAVRPWIDAVSMDLKLPSSTLCRSFWAEHREMLDMARGMDLFVKAVITAGTLKDDVQYAAELIASVDHRIPLYLQPNTAELNDGSLERCREFLPLCLEFLRDVRIVPQVHRLLGIH